VSNPADPVTLISAYFGTPQRPVAEAYGSDALDFTPSQAAVAPAELAALSHRSALRDHLDLTQRADDLEAHRA